MQDSKTKKAVKYVAGFLFRAITGSIVSRTQNAIAEKIISVEKKIQGVKEDKEVTR